MLSSADNRRTWDSLNTFKNHFNVHRQTNDGMFLVFQPQVHWNKSYLWRIKFVKTERIRRYLHSVGGSSSKSRPVVVLLRQGSVFNLEGFVHFPAGLQLDNCSGEKWLTDRVGGKNLQRPFVPAFKPVSLTNYIRRGISSVPATATLEEGARTGSGISQKSIR